MIYLRIYRNMDNVNNNHLWSLHYRTKQTKERKNSLIERERDLEAERRRERESRLPLSLLRNRSL